MSKTFREILKDLESVNENVTTQELSQAFADKPNAQEAMRVFNLLKTHSPEQLTNEDRMEATRILKFLLPDISANEVFDKIEQQQHEIQQQEIKATTRAPQQQVQTQTVQQSQAPAAAPPSIIS